MLDMEKAERVKKALRVCSEDGYCKGKGCPYEGQCEGGVELDKDALEVIENLEERIAIMEEGKWISTKDRFPAEEEEMCLIYADGKIACVDRLTVIDGELYQQKFVLGHDGKIGQEYAKAEYWMRIPCPPKVEQEDNDEHNEK